MRHHTHLLRHLTDWKVAIREWLDELFTDSITLISASSGTLSVDNDIWHLVCTGSPTINLQAASERTHILTITNAGTGVVTISPVSGEVIGDDTSVTLDFQWTSIQLLPKTGGYVII